MKHLRLSILSCLLLFAGLSVHAQGYYYIFQTGTVAPYEYNEADDAYDIMSSGNDQMSAQQQMPFTWSFYGIPVSQYFVSDNGYITFTNPPGSSDPNNIAIPDGAAPTNAIFAFWDDLDYGSFGKVRAWDQGVAPNRIHCVQWSNMTRSGTTSTLTFTLRIHESGHFDIIHDHSAGNSVLNTNGTVGAQDATGNNAMMIGNAFFAFPDITTDNTDDAVYVVDFGTQYQRDLTVLTTDIKPATAAGSYNVSGRVKNLGSMQITNFDINFQVDNGPVQSDGASTLTLVQNGGEFTYFHLNQVDFPNSGTFYNVKIWASNLNGQVDQNPANDTLTLEVITVLGINAPKKVVIEEFTATWCGACPTALEYMDTCYANFPGQVIGIATHAGGSSFEYTQNTDDLFDFYKVGGIPDGVVDRAGQPFGAAPNVYPTAWPTFVAARLNEPCPVAVEVYNTYDPGTRVCSGQVVMRFSDYALGDMRAILFVTEDGLPGNQAGLGPYTFDHILRMMPMGEFGTPGTIPAFVNPDEVYVENFSFTIPNGVDINNINLVGAVNKWDIDSRKHEILNAGEFTLDNGVSAQSPTSESRSLGILPNPVQNMGAIKIDFAKPADARFSLFNAVGQEIRVIKEGKFTRGTHHVYFDASQLPAGIYYINVSSDQGNFTEKVVVQ
ncbi:MAG: Omp28-related outer membrane protein [Bacteroidota bacterium]